MAARIRQVKERGNRLVYLAEISGEGARVGLRELDPSHPCYTLPAGDNLFAIHSRHYSTTPLVIQGPGGRSGCDRGGSLRRHPPGRRRRAGRKGLRPWGRGRPRRGGVLELRRRGKQGGEEADGPGGPGEECTWIRSGG